MKGTQPSWRTRPNAASEMLAATTRCVAGLGSTDRAPHHRAFLDEIRAGGDEATGLRDELRAAMQHLIAASDAREPTAFPVVFAGGLVSLGMVAYLTAPTPNLTRHGDSTVGSLFVLAHLVGLVGLLLSLSRSPGHVRRVPFIALALLPTLVGSFGSAVFPGQRFEGLAVVANSTTRTADVVVAVSCVVMLVGCLGRRARTRLFGIGWRLFACGCLASAAGQVPWAFEFAVHDDPLWVAGSVLSGGGLVLLSVGMMRHVPLVRGEASSWKDDSRRPRGLQRFVGF